MSIDKSLNNSRENKLRMHLPHVKLLRQTPSKKIELPPNRCLQICFFRLNLLIYPANWVQGMQLGGVQFCNKMNFWRVPGRLALLPVIFCGSTAIPSAYWSLCSVFKKLSSVGLTLLLRELSNSPRQRCGRARQCNTFVFPVQMVSNSVAPQTQG